MRKIQVTIILIAAILAIVGGIAWHQALGSVTTYTYAGKVVFETEEEYGDFKRLIGREDIAIQKVGVYSSAPPIVVDFYVSTLSTVEFPYGKATESNNAINNMVFVGAMCAAGWVGFSVLVSLALRG